MGWRWVGEIVEELSLHILDIVENSLRAGARNVEIKVSEISKDDLLEIEITDDGAGMDNTTLEKALDPFFTTKTVRKVGLGLSLFREAARSAGGDMDIDSHPGRGTRIKARFQYGHVDRQPLGDIAKTLETLITANPEVRFRYLHRRDDEEFGMDTQEQGDEFPAQTDVHTHEL